ncbi:MAG: TolC family protein [Candidatus Manganitrophaceae bacterium]|nr:MAG: TolC family protein [Candidatus Manganitrophaceae bacterium]
MKRLSLFLYFLFIAAGASTVVSEAAERTPEILVLKDLLQEVADKNLEILAARKQELAAEARIPQARAWDDPQIGVTQWSIPSNFNLGKADETWYTLSQTFPFLGKRTLRGNVTALEQTMANEDSREVTLRVIREAKQAYYDLFFARKALEIHHAQVDLARRFSQITQERFSIGAVGQQDVLRAQMELLHLSNDVEALEQERETSEARLNTLLNRPTDAPLGAPQAPAVPTTDLRLETLQREAEESRPENRMQILAIRRSEESIKLARRDLFPDVTAEVAYWDVHDGPNRWMASIKISLPWINKKKYDARIHEGEAERARAQAARQTAINQTAFRVKALLVRIETSKRLAKLYETGILPLAEQSLEAATIGYQAKRNDFLTLIDAQKNLKELELTYFRTLTEIEKSLAELDELTGKTF